MHASASQMACSTFGTKALSISQLNTILVSIAGDPSLQLDPSLLYCLRLWVKCALTPSYWGLFTAADGTICGSDAFCSLTQVEEQAAAEKLARDVGTDKAAYAAQASVSDSTVKSKGACCPICTSWKDNRET